MSNATTRTADFAARRCREFRRSSSRRLRLETLEDRRLLSVAPEAQALVYLLNEARNNPEAYARAQNLGIDLSTVAPQPPLAVDDDLFASASLHAQDMAANNYFGHDSPDLTASTPNEMVRSTGYNLPLQITVGSTIYQLPDDSNQVEALAAGTLTAENTLNTLLIDATDPSLGHRVQLLGMDSFFALDREIGVGHAISGSGAPLFADYWAIHTALSSTTQSFLTGVVYNDVAGTRQYAQGEGLGGVTVSADGLSTTTNSAGGWSLPVPDGSYLVTASGGPLATAITVPATVRGENVEVDFISGDPQASVDFRPWVDAFRNPTNALDVNGDNLVSSLDALVVINALNAGNGGVLSGSVGAPAVYLDVNGDGLLSPLDALDILNSLNAAAAAGSAATLAAVTVAATMPAVAVNPAANGEGPTLSIAPATADTVATRVPPATVIPLAAGRMAPMSAGQAARPFSAPAAALAHDGAIAELFGSR
jgi:uncharacterized protein YkwD